MKSFIRSLLFALAFATGAWVPVQAQTLDQAVAAFQRADYKTAFAGFKKFADQGNAESQYNLGQMYAYSVGVPRDDQQAAAWYRKAAEQGLAVAQLNLGNVYAKGHGVPKDDQTAYFWWLLASAQGDQSATKNLGLVQRRLLPAQRANAQAGARVWKPK